MSKISEILAGPKMTENKPYQFKWFDGSVVRFTVKSVTPRRIFITFDNGVENHFSVGSAMHKESVPC